MNYTHHNVLYGYTMAEHRIMACGSCHSFDFEMFVD